MAGLAFPVFPRGVLLPGSVSTHGVMSSASLRTGSTITMGREKGPIPSSTLNVPSEKQGHRATGRTGTTYSVDDLALSLAYTSSSSTSLSEKADTTREPRTLAFYLFWIGFLIPFAWLVGSLLLVVPVTSLGGRDAEGGVYGKGDPFMIRRRTAERKWAGRSMTAAGIAVCIGLILGIAIWQGLGSRGS